MKKDRITYLFKLYLERKLSASEEDEFLQAIEDTPQENLEEIIAELIDNEKTSYISYEEWDKLISSSVRIDIPAKSKNKLKLLYRYTAAAVLLIIASFVLYFYSGTKDVISEDAIVKNIKPGENKAILITSKGAKVSLDMSLDSNKVYALDSAITGVSDGELRYGKNNNSEVEGEITYNTLKVPRGGKYRLVLSDGTALWLNSESELRFPSHFASNLREVELKGEAYFEVTSIKGKKWPFSVKTEHQQIQVLGTKFNVSAYSNEDLIKTSLLEGKVRVVLQKGGGVNTLKPGQEAALSRGSNQVKVYTAEVEEAIAWKDDLFLFNNEGVIAAMNKISRWYDVDIVYKGNFADKAFWGTTPRSEKLETLLKTLQLTGVAKFKIEGRSVIVMQ